MVAQREIWWADLGVPVGSAPGYRRPVLVVQSDSLNQSRIATVICVALTSNTTWASVRANVLLPAEETGLPQDSVANVSQLITIDRGLLLQRVGKISSAALASVFAGIDLVLGR